MAGRFTEDSKKLLEYVGGRENIAAVSHCVTRMRFVLNDPSKADTGAIESLASAKGTFTQAGQFQVIIGNEVSTFYNDFVAVAGIEGVSKDAVKKAAKQNQNMLQRIMSSLAEIFAPLIPAIIVGGLILGFRNIIGEIALFDGGDQDLDPGIRVLGRHEQLSVADRRGCVPFPACMYCMVYHKEDGDYPGTGDRAGHYTGLAPAS